MQNIPFYELLRSVKEQLLARVVRLTLQENLAILQLITEAIPGGNLIESRFAP
jgi:hypothetical protein